MVATLVTLQKYVFGPISDGQQCCPPELLPNNVGWLKKIHDSLGDRREDDGEGGRGCIKRQLIRLSLMPKRPMGIVKHAKCPCLAPHAT